MSFCPLIKDKCKEEKCSFWVKEAEIKEEVKCVFRFLLHLGPLTLELSPEEEEDILLRREKEREERINKASQELKKRSAEEIARELMDFIKERYPEAISDSLLLRRVFELFWIDKGLSGSDFYVDPSLSQLKAKVELMVEIGLKSARFKDITREISSEVLDQLKKKSLDELAEDILEHWKKELTIC